MVIAGGVLPEGVGGIEAGGGVGEGGGRERISSLICIITTKATGVSYLSSNPPQATSNKERNETY